MIYSLSISILLHNADAQTRYSVYNTTLIDSITKSYSRVCTSIVSSKQITRNGISQDKKRVQFLNEFFNYDLPFDDIRRKMNRFFNGKMDFKTQNLGQIIKYETSVESNGKLDMKISFSIYWNEIVFKYFDITTSTRSDCIEPNYIYGMSQIDLNYLKENILPVADFPMHTLKFNGKIICDTVYFLKLTNSTDSTLFQLNNSFPKRINLLTLFGLDIYRSHQTDPDILRLVKDQDTGILFDLLYSPNFYVAIHAMEALKYLHEVNNIFIAPEYSSKMNLIEMSDFLITWTYTDVVKRDVRYKDLNVSLKMIKSKYDSALELLNIQTEH